MSTKGLTNAQQQAILSQIKLVNSTGTLTTSQMTNVLITETRNEADAKALLLNAGLISSETAEATATNTVTTAKLRELVATGQLTQAEAQLLATKAGVTLANQKEASSFALLCGKLKNLGNSLLTIGKIHPVFSLLTLGVTLFTTAVTVAEKKNEKFIESQKELIEKIDENISKYDEEISSLGSLQEKLQDAKGDKEALASIQSELNKAIGDTPGLLNEESNAYDVANQKIDDRIKRLETLRQLELDNKVTAQKEIFNNTLVDNAFGINHKFDYFSGHKVIVEDLFNAPFAKYVDDDLSTRFSTLQDIFENLKKNNYGDGKKSNAEIWKELIDSYGGAMLETSEIQDFFDNQTKYAQEILSDFINNSESIFSKEELNSIIENLVESGYSQDLEGIKDVITSLVKNDELESTINDYYESLYDDKVDSEALYQNIKNQFDTLIDNYPELKSILENYFNNIGTDIETGIQEVSSSIETTPFDFSSWFEDDDNKDAVSNATSNINTLSSALDTLKSKDLSQSDLDELLVDLLPQFPELQKYTDGTVSSVSSLRQGIIELCAVQPDSLIEMLETLKETENVTEEVRKQIDLYIQSLENMSNLADKSATNLTDWLNIDGNEDAINEAVSAISTLEDAYDKLLDPDLTQGDLSELLEDLIKEFPQLATATDGTLKTVDQLRAAIGKLCEQQPNVVIQQLRELESKVETEEARNQIEQLIKALENLDSINIDMDDTTTVIQNMEDSLQELAEFVEAINDEGGLHLDFDEAREYLKLFPELLENATICADGTVQLNEQVVNDFIKGREAEIQSDGQARVEELQNARTVLEAKRAYAQSKLDVVLAALDSQSVADMQETQNEINNTDAALESAVQARMDEVQANQIATEAMSGNHDALNDLVSQAAEEESRNMAESLATMATNSQTQFGVVQKNIDATIDKMNNLAQAVVNSMRGEQTSKTQLTVYGAGSKSMSQSITTTSPLSEQGKFDNATQLLDSIVKNPSSLIKQQMEQRQAELTESLNALKSTLQSEIFGYDSAISSIDKQIQMLNASLQVDLDDYVSNIERKNAENTSTKDSGSSEPNPETFDWIEIRIQEYEKLLDQLNSKVDDVYSTWNEREQALNQAISLTQDSIGLQAQAYTRYMQEAESVGLSAYWKNLVQHGAIDISVISDENLADKINSYQEWYEKAQDCLDAQKDLQDSLNELNSQKFTNLQSEYESIIGLLEQQKDLLEGQITLLSKKGDYGNLKKQQEEVLSNLYAERDALQSTLDELNIKKDTEEWNELYSQILDIEQSIQDAENSLKEIDSLEFNNLQEVFEFDRSQFEHIVNMIQDQIDLLETKSLFANESYYRGMIEYTQSQISNLQKERKELQDVLSNSSYEVGTSEWNNMYSTIQSIDEEISSLTVDIAKFNVELRDTNWEVFEYLENMLEKITDESEYLTELLATYDLYDKNGNLNEYGNATIALHAANYEVYKQQSQDYLKEMQELEKQLASGAGKDVLEQYYKMKEAHQDAVLAAQEEKEAILDLVSDGYQKQIDYLNEIISKKKESLNVEKDLYNYQKTIKEKTDNIASLEKQIVSTSGDDSESAMAKMQKLQVQLQEAKDDLKETEYEQYLSDTENMLDQLSEDYETWMNQRIDNSDALLAEIIGEINLQGGDVISTLNDVASEYGTMISDSITTIFSSESPFSTVLNTLNDGVTSGFEQVNTGISGVSQAIENLIAKVAEIVNADDLKTNTETIDIGNNNKTGDTGTSSASTKGSSSTNTNSTSNSTTLKNTTSNGTQGDGKVQIGDKVNVNGDYWYTAKGPDGANTTHYPASGEYYISGIYDNTGKYWKGEYTYAISKKKGGTSLGWVTKSQLSGYAKGGLHINDDDFAWTQENGSEIIVRKDGAVLTPMKNVDTVFTHEMTEKLWNIAKGNNIMPSIAQRYPDFPTNKEITSSIDVGGINVQFELPNVTNYKEFVNKLIDDSRFEKAMCTMINNSIMGKSTLKKLNYRY